MSRSTIDRIVIIEQLAEAKRLHAEAEQARAIIEANDKTELEKAWQCGKRLNLLKEQLPHGEWQPFLETNWPELPYRTAALYMKIDRENPNVQRVADLKHDSIRAYMISKVPNKSHPKQAGDSAVGKAGADHTSVANELNRLAQRVATKQLALDEEEAREDFEPGYRFLQRLFGDA